MKTIWKQVVEPNSQRNDPFYCEFEAPVGSEPISAGVQNGLVCIWYECEPVLKKVPTRVVCVGTGFGSVPDNCRFIGTVVDGPYVWHFYAEL